MSADPRRLRAGELARLLNSTPLGEVTSDRQIYRHRTKAGFRIAAEGDESRIDLLRYAAWLAAQRHIRPDAQQPADYQTYRDRKGREAREQSVSGRDIGELPEIAKPRRRKRAAGDFRYFCEQYCAQRYTLKWSPDHLKIIAKIERSVLEGELFAMAMPRGSGKTTLCEDAAKWAMLNGHRVFVAMIGASETAAAEMLASVKSDLEHNDALLADYPEVCYPIRQLEGITQRAVGQLYQGRRTSIRWTDDEIVLPTIAGSVASGAIVRVGGITGRIRGMKYQRQDGVSVRPDLVLVDDPQTDESAMSPPQCEKRERVVNGAILGLAGPGKKIAGMMPMTVVRKDDLADRVLDREKNPEWQGERTKMLYSFPENEKLWSEYAEIRARSLAAGEGLAQATAFYRKHRKAMDAGAKPAWKHRFNTDELSAVQHAMNLYLRDERSFFAEYQNEPIDDTPGETDLDAETICAKVNNTPRGVVPQTATKLTAFVDVQGKALYYLVAAWEDSFTGYIVDYGTEPDQKRDFFTLRDIKRSLMQSAPGAGQEGAIYAGLERLFEKVIAAEFRREDGSPVRVDRCLIDANWGASTDVVYQFCRRSSFAGLAVPSHGRFVGASSKPFSEYRRKRGERAGLNWRVPIASSKRSIRHVLYDTNYWKSFLYARLAVQMGDPGSLTLFGSKPHRHRMIAEQLTAEYRVRTEGRGRTVDEWKLRAGGVDNHLLDCAVGAAVAASMEGVSLEHVLDLGKSERKRVSMAELQRQRREKK